MSSSQALRALQRPLIPALAAGVGCGAVLILGYAFRSWYRSRPQPWDETSLRAVTAEASELRILKTAPDRRSGYRLEYGLENETDRDILIGSQDAAVMKQQKSTRVLEPFEGARLTAGTFIPAHKRALLTVDVSEVCEDARTGVLQGSARDCYRSLIDDADKFLLIAPEPHRMVSLPVPPKLLTFDDGWEVVGETPAKGTASMNSVLPPDFKPVSKGALDELDKLIDQVKKGPKKASAEK